MAEPTEVATLGGGCFWCVEAVLEQLRGVSAVESGYSGGHVEQPTYRQVCTADTGHAEVVRVTFDPGQISYRQLLEVFFATHDPTTADRQGNDVGPQYRSVIFYHSPQQKQTAEEVIAWLNAEQVFSRPIVTRVEPAGRFWKAEDYHQGYYQANPTQGYCVAVISPKVAKLRQRHAGLLKG